MLLSVSLYCGYGPIALSCIISKFIHDQPNSRLLTFNVYVLVQMPQLMIKATRGMCNLPLQPVWFSSFGGRYSLDSIPRVVHLKYRPITVTTGFCLLSSQVIQTSRCNRLDKTLLSTVLLNRGKLSRCAFIHDSSPIQ